jgi:tRNA dimethylallyltransferase
VPVDLRVMTLPRAELVARIDRRIDERLAVGMVEEVEGLINKGISREWLINCGLEYRAITEWLSKDTKDEGELRTRLQRDIHAYARRQETFIRTQLAHHSRLILAT